MTLYNFFILTMHKEEIRNKIIPFLQSHGAVRIGLFGSAARDELRKGSDVDILVDIEKDISLLEFVAIKQELEEMLGRRVDLIEYQMIKPSLRDKILKTQVVLL